MSLVVLGSPWLLSFAHLCAYVSVIVVFGLMVALLVCLFPWVVGLPSLGFMLALATLPQCLRIYSTAFDGFCHRAYIAAVLRRWLSLLARVCRYLSLVVATCRWLSLVVSSCL